MTDLYPLLLSQLPAALKPDLTLDLASDSIIFNLPGTTVDPFVTAGTTDIGLFADISLTNNPVPEPSGLVPAGLLALGAFRLLRAGTRAKSGT